MRWTGWIMFLGFVLNGCGQGQETGDADTAPERGQAVGPMTTDAGSAAREIIDASKDACAATHPLIGVDLPLKTRSHGVRGTVRLVNDCTLVISDFSYDGKGLQVELVGSIGGSFVNGVSLSRDLLRPNQAYEDAQLIVRVPEGMELTMIDGLSVWCADVAVSFGDVSFVP